jgi:predicted nucleic acid-binding protein
MKVVIDANRIFASLLKDNTSRKILFNTQFQFFAPECIKEEVKKYNKELEKKMGITEKDIEIILKLFFERINIIPKEQYEKQTVFLEKMLTDKNDIPYLALAIKIKAKGIWTHDSHFRKQREVRIFTNIDLLREEIGY